MHFQKKTNNRITNIAFVVLVHLLVPVVNNSKHVIKWFVSTRNVAHFLRSETNFERRKMSEEIQIEIVDIILRGDGGGVVATPLRLSQNILASCNEDLCNDYNCGQGVTNFTHSHLQYILSLKSRFSACLCACSRSWYPVLISLVSISPRVSAGLKNQPTKSHVM
ncbi:hypothetical protein FF38_07570 [Lucilia cuprina]|uniref:Uncharacterized protein n=1 Tax=Lucilia cuprina TaxID=7375 RepID=A0A0L0C1W7_LUCCU|nr:hypothetical protein FF38_07570 [Lucilia cuprina]